MKGYVYALSNPGMPGLIKIGRSKGGGRGRAGELDGTGIPFPFEVEFECLFEDCVSAEHQIHGELDCYRINPKREFFKISVEEAKEAILRLCAHEIEHTVLAVDLSVCASRMSAIANKFQIAPPVPYELVDFISDAAWAEAVKLRADRLSKHKASHLSVVPDECQPGDGEGYIIACRNCGELVDENSMVMSAAMCNGCFTAPGNRHKIIKER
jgi:hypothetical protein